MAQRGSSSARPRRHSISSAPPPTTSSAPDHLLRPRPPPPRRPQPPPAVAARAAPNHLQRQQQMDLAEPTFPVPSASTMAFPAPAGPCSGGSKSVLDGMAGPSMKPVELEELAASSMKPVHLEEMAGPSMNPVELEELDPMGDVDKQRLKWETINEDQQVWDALDEQRKLRKKEEMKQRQEERKHKQEERRHKQEERRLKQEYNKKIKLEVAARRKELQDRKKKQANELQDTRT
ncbi:uncharacterized protein [Lolium perenne]|uniref:uncharacterized protein n=1 Tax=Lolium perenne TaxID=4522 RepID=UPI0021F525BD|nr:uncharacterized protein LOC127328783 [Lolium perenne]